MHLSESVCDSKIYGLLTGPMIIANQRNPLTVLIYIGLNLGHRLEFFFDIDRSQSVQA